MSNKSLYEHLDILRKGYNSYKETKDYLMSLSNKERKSILNSYAQHILAQDNYKLDNIMEFDKWLKDQGILGFDLFDALNSLREYDNGTNSGIPEEELRQSVREYLSSLSGEERIAVFNNHAIQLLSSPGNSLEDIVNLYEWLIKEGMYYGT